jgi:hypothetical protein
MTGVPGTGSNPLDHEIADAMGRGDHNGALEAIARAHLLVPQAEVATGQEPDTFALPVLEQDGKQFVPAFTTPERAEGAGAQPDSLLAVDAAALGGGWPDGDELWLAINPGWPDGLTLPAGAVRLLPTLSNA